MKTILANYKIGSAIIPLVGDVQYKKLNNTWIYVISFGEVGVTAKFDFETSEKAKQDMMLAAEEILKNGFTRM